MRLHRSTFLAFLLFASVAPLMADKDVHKHVTNICKGSNFNIYRFDQPVITFSFFGKSEEFRPLYEKAIRDINGILTEVGTTISIVDDGDKTANIQYTLNSKSSQDIKFRSNLNPNNSLANVWVQQHLDPKWKGNDEEAMRNARLSVVATLGFFNRRYSSKERLDTIWVDDSKKYVSTRSLSGPTMTVNTLPSDFTELDREIIKFHYTLPINTKPWEITRLAKERFDENKYPTNNP